MFKSNSIRTHVIKYVDEIINETQKKYDDRCEEITREAEQAKMLAREEAVETIIGKFK